LFQNFSVNIQPGGSDLFHEAVSPLCGAPNAAREMAGVFQASLRGKFLIH
jgi:hypothetical protein